MSKQIFSALRIIALALAVSFGISYVYAWTAPTVTPPGGNVSAPINTSATEQYKEGTLGIGGLIRGYANAIFDGNVGIGTTAPTQKLDVAGNIKGTGLCIGTDCKTAWPASGGATPPAGSEFLNTSATAQTKAGGLTVGQTKFSNSDVYFTDTNHNHTGIGNTAGHAAIENAANYNTLMILGRSGTPQGRSVSIWDYLTVNGGQTVTGALTTAGLTTTNRLTVGEAGGAYSVVTMKDDESPYGVKYIHANSNVVGFLSGYGGWLSYWDNAGSQYNVGNINANDYYIRASGKWASQLGAGGGTPSVGVYQCPQGTGGWNPGGYWGSYGCQGQISSASTCTNIEFPSTQVRNCTYLGTLRIN